MEWYWWVLIAAAVIAIGVVKVKVFSIWLARRKAEEERLSEES